MEIYCVIEIAHFLSHLSEADNESIMMIGNYESILQVLSDLEMNHLNYFKNIIVATDNVYELFYRYFAKSRLSIIKWDENDIGVDQFFENRKYIKMVIDFNPTLRRLHRIYHIIDSNSVVILRNQPPQWKEQYSMLFDAFKAKISNVINFESFAGYSDDNKSYCGAKEHLYLR